MNVCTTTGTPKGAIRCRATDCAGGGTDEAPLLPIDDRCYQDDHSKNAEADDSNTPSGPGCDPRPDGTTSHTGNPEWCLARCSGYLDPISGRPLRGRSPGFWHGHGVA